MIKKTARACLTMLVPCSLLLLGTSRSYSQVKKDSTELQEEIKSNIPVIVLDDNDAENGSSSSGQSISSILYGGRDPYFSSVFNWSAARFKIRGYDGSYTETYINGAPVKKLTNGYTSWSLWGGLNDVMRSRVTSNGLRPVDYAFGDIGGTNYIDTRASKQSPGLNVSYAYSNRNFNHRVMASWASGMSKKGWAFAISASYRYADQGYVKGTFYNGASYFLSVDKKINSKHLLSFTTFGTPTQNGMPTAATQEAYNLAGSNYYNPSWGYQNGKVRSSNYYTIFQPYFILNHEWTISSTSNLKTSVSYSFGNRTRTTLDWYNSPDPRPDYYRNLPSYQTDDAATAKLVADRFSTDEYIRQVKWDQLYDANRINKQTVNGVTGRRSRYLLQDRVTHTDRASFNSVYNSKLDKHADFTAGITYSIQKDHNYNRVNDLLGGDYYVNRNQFGERSYPGDSAKGNPNLDDPNPIKRVGDKYGNDYSLNLNEAKAFMQTNFTFNHVDFFVAGSYAATTMWREGYARNGLFPTTSQGKSQELTFLNYSAKAGVTYKIDGRNYIFANGSYGSRAPFIENVFVSPRIRNTIQDNVRNEQVISAEAGYVLNWEKLKFRLNGYYARFAHAVDVMSYYDDSQQNFVNYALSNIGKENFGLEIGFEVPLYKGLTAKGAANIGRYYYTTRQEAIVTVDNSAAVVAKETVYAKNYRVGQTPQEAYSLGLNYSGKGNWFANINWNYYNSLWIDINPVKLTDRATEGVKNGSDQWKSILKQQEINGQYTVDFYGGKTFRVRTGRKSSTVVLSAGINNLLNKRNLITGGFEQLRFDYTDKNVNKFPPKYYYGYGINYFITLGLKL
ncbi:TonB-dependent receptor [Filimonas lacunae]|uniref:TonB-dependent receptor n=1 Tax=Filimonas lacunae TaxID=477680 RepID=UPI0007D71DDF|nr:TonB-dependent receptor [Filimonas lacunae]BAV08412.1 hypothetical protein FLA_4448 [Filimonas lacunae]